MLLLSVGLTCGTIFSNDGMFTIGTRISVPDSPRGSTVPISRSTAMIDAYSRAVRARHDGEHRPRLRAVKDDDGNVVARVDAGRHLQHADRFLPARRGRGADGE